MNTQKIILPCMIFLSLMTFTFCERVSRDNLFDAESADYVGRAPKNLSASDGTHAEYVELTWSKVSKANSYAIFKEEDGKLFYVGSSDTTSYLDETVEDKKVYTYRVAAVFELGNNGEFTESDTGFSEIPTVQNLVASDGTEADSVTLSWDACEGASGYKIYRSMGDGEKKLLKETTTNSYTDTNIRDLIVYSYQVSAFYSKRYPGTRSEQDTGYCLELAPPTNVSADRGKEDGEITVTFSPVDGAESYDIYRSEAYFEYTEESEISGYSKIGSTDAVEYTDTTVENGKQYYYKVEAVNSTSNRKSGLGFSDWGLALDIHTTQHGAIQLRQIPIGDFVMGHSGIADPLRLVTITQNFYLGTTEVTYGQWKAVKDSAPGSYTFGSDGMSGTTDDRTDSLQPVVGIDYFDAIVFCNLLTELEFGDNLECVYLDDGTPIRNSATATDVEIDRTRKGYRLPLEAEWELAARAWTKKSYYWGDGYSFQDIDPYAFFSYNSYTNSQAVMQKKPNNFNLFDISGNVHELCLEVYEEYSYSATAVTDPPETIAQTGPRIIRGGSHRGGPGDILSGARKQIGETDERLDVGFRIAKYGE
jgi:sulfatase modifying factor 1